MTEEEASDGSTTELHQSNREEDLKPALGGLEFTAVSQTAKQRSCEIKDAEVNAQDSHIQPLKPLIVVVDVVSDIVVVVVEVQRSQKEECIPQNDTSSRHTLSLPKLKKMKFNNLMILAKVATQNAVESTSIHGERSRPCGNQTTFPTVISSPKISIKLNLQKYDKKLAISETVAPSFGETP